MEIKNCTLTDIDEILLLYEAARNLQTQRNMVVWPIFSHAFIEKEVKENRQWKLVSENSIVCNWAITFNDLEIWGEKEKNDAIYIHRICTHPAFYGNRFIHTIVVWAKTYALQSGKRYVRLDTLGNNTRLIEHYTSARFTFLGIFRLPDTSNLPGHYQLVPDCCLFEIDLQQ